ncbi:Leucine-rich repeats and WD repeat domain-containing protein 1, partial [Rhizopus stolonifer]
KMNNSRLITKRRLSYSTSLSSSSSSNDSDASMSSVDTEGLLEEQDVPLPHAILNEGDDDKDERSFYRIPKTKGRPKKKLVLEQQQTTISMPKKKRGRPRKNWNEAMETKGDALKNSLSPEREPESSMEENNEHAKNTKRLKMTYNQNKEFKNDLPKSSSSNESSDDSDNESKPKSPTETLRDPESVGVSGSVKDKSDDEAPRRKKKSPKVRRKPAMDKTFTEVSLDNIIRRRDIVARNPEAYKNKKFITRSSRRLDYKESSSDECLDDSNNERKDTHKKNVNKKPQRRGTKQINETKKQNQQREANTRRRRRNNSKENTAALPIINENYKLSLLIENRVTALTDDEPTEPWCCDFEPHRTGQVQTDIAALAGSNTVFFLDARQGRYIKKYTHPETQEAFQCLAWTTLHIDHESDSSSDEDEETCNVLAIAGKLGSIKLLNPLQNECYRYLFGHRDVVLKMVFSEFEPRWLF